VRHAQPAAQDERRGHTQAAAHPARRDEIRQQQRGQDGQQYQRRANISIPTTPG